MARKCCIAAIRSRCVFSALEAIKQAVEVIAFLFRALLFGGAAADFVHQLAGALPWIIGQHVVVGAKLPRRAGHPAKGVLLLRLAVLTELIALLALTFLLLLGHGLTQLLHPLAEGIHRTGLIIDRAGQIAFLKVAGGIVHGAPCLIECVARGLTGLTALTGEVLLQPPKLIAEGLLTLCQ